ncbi:MAG: hypothetical protein Q8K60_04560, partial [Parachlamydiaceae bacterium]|nr:hypothetical protein [Parachlamydiaceae bacterium]
FLDKKTTHIIMPVGIPNFGNTCFLSVIIQAMMFIPELREAVLKMGEFKPIYKDIYTAYTEKQKNNSRSQDKKCINIYREFKENYLSELEDHVFLKELKTSKQNDAYGIFQMIINDLSKHGLKPFVIEFELTEKALKALETVKKDTNDFQICPQYNKMEQYQPKHTFLYQLLISKYNTDENKPEILTELLKNRIQMSRLTNLDLEKESKYWNDNLKYYNPWYSLEHGTIVRQFAKLPEHFIISFDNLFNINRPSNNLEIYLSPEQVKNGQSAKYACDFYIVYEKYSMKVAHFFCRMKINNNWFEANDNRIKKISLATAKKGAASSRFLHFRKINNNPEN